MITPALTDRLWASTREEYLDLLDDSISNQNLFERTYTNLVKQQVCSITNRKHCVFTNSGTSAILLSLIAHGVKPGDEVICANVSYPASCNQVALLGATPVFVDIDQHGHIDADQIEQYVTDKTVAILPVGLYGENYNYDKIKSVALKHNLPIIEDSAQSYGTSYKGISAGKLGDTGILSFSRNKPAMTPFGSGALVTDDDSIAEIAQSTKTHGKHRRDVPILSKGINAQAKEDRAIAAYLSLNKMSAWNQRRCSIYQQFEQTCAEKGLEIRPRRPTSTNNGHKFTFFVDDVASAKKHFAEHGISLEKYYPDNFEHSLLGQNKRHMPVSEQFINHSVVLSTDPYLTDEEVELMCKTILLI